jgi:hypothetical protein
MADIRELGKKVKSKHPEYADMDDAELGRRMKAKFPGAYDDFTEAPTMAPDQAAAHDRMQGQLQRAGVPPEDQSERTWVDTAKSLTTGAVNAAKGVYNTAERVVKGPQGVDEEILTALAGPLGPLIKDTVMSHIATGKKANEALEKGNYVEGTLQTLLAGAPVVGPMASNIAENMSAVDEFGRPKPGAFAEGVGEMATAVLAPEVAKRLPAAAAELAPVLKGNAERQYAQVLGATKQGNKLRSERIVPEMLDRGVTGATLKSMGEKVAGEVQRSGQAIGDAFATLPPDARISLANVESAITKAADDALTVLNPQTGELVPMGPEAVAGQGHVAGIVDALKKAAIVDPATGEAFLTAGTARRVRQFYDQIVKDAGGFEGRNLADRSKAGAHEMAADAIREELAKDFPDIAALNKEFSFWKDADRVIQDTLTRRQGQAKPLGRKIAAAAGTAGGFASGGISGAIVGKAAMEALDSVTSSAGWKSVSAVTKNRIADALAKGAKGPAEHYIRVAVEQAAKATRLPKGPSAPTILDKTAQDDERRKRAQQ